MRWTPLIAIPLLVACNVFDDGGGFREADTGADEDAGCETCAGLCDSYCSLMSLQCPGVYASDAACRQECASFAEGGIAGDTLNCRLVVAASAGADPTACESAGPTGGSICIDGGTTTPCEQLCELQDRCSDDAVALDECIAECTAAPEDERACAVDALDCSELVACGVPTPCRTYCDAVGGCDEFVDDADCVSWCEEQTATDQACLSGFATPGAAFACDGFARSLSLCRAVECDQACMDCTASCTGLLTECRGFEPFFDEDACLAACEGGDDLCLTEVAGCGKDPALCLPVELSPCDEYCGLMRTFCPATAVGSGDADCLATCAMFEADEQTCRLDFARGASKGQSTCQAADGGSPGCGVALSCSDLCESGITCGAVSEALLELCVETCREDDQLASCWVGERCPAIAECGCNVFDDGTCPDSEGCRPLGPRGGGVCMFGIGVRGDTCNLDTGCGNGLVCDQRPCSGPSQCAGFACINGVCSVGHCVAPCSLSEPSDSYCQAIEVCDPSNPLNGTPVCVARPGGLTGLGSPCENVGELCADQGVCALTPDGVSECFQACGEDDDCVEGTQCEVSSELGVGLCGTL